MANITTYTAGPAISIKRLMAFMPCQNTIACSSHMVAKQSQPRVDSPRKLLLVSEEREGQNLSRTSIRAFAAR